jgi:hypothetical protein
MAKGVGALLAGVLLFGGVLTAVVVGGATPAAAQQSVTLYVTQSGSGSACSQGAPCGSVSAAISTATGGTYDGDDVTIDVAGGTYSENDTVDASLLDSLTIDGEHQLGDHREWGERQRGRWPSKLRRNVGLRHDHLRLDVLERQFQ